MTQKLKSVAKRFARAIIELAKEQGAVETTLRELNLIGESMRKVPPLRILMDDKIVPLNEKKKIIRELADLFSFSKLTTNFLLYLTEKNRFSLFNDIAKEYHNIFDTLSNLARATAAIAEPSLVDSTRQRIEQILSRATGMKVICETNVDRSLIGGAVVKIGDLSLDASITGKLNNMREELI